MRYNYKHETYFGGVSIVKKISVVFFIISFLFCLISCGKSNVILKKGNLKIGVVAYADEKDANIAKHLSAINEMKLDLKLKDNKLIIKKNVTEENCYKTITDLVNLECNLILAVGDGFEDYMVQSALENPDVHFCVANGIQAATSEIDNLHSYSMKEFESRYIAGVAAGLKLNELIKNEIIFPYDLKIGYVASTTGAENVSAYSAFFLGAKSVCSDVKMEVKYVDSKNNIDSERIAANALISSGNIIIAQQSYLNGAAETCQQNNVFYVGCIASTVDIAPDYAITSVDFDWKETYSFLAACILNHDEIPSEWSGGTKIEGEFISSLNERAFISNESYTSVNENIKSVEKKLIEEKLRVFDINKFTVNGKKITSTLSYSNKIASTEEKDNYSYRQVYDNEYISKLGYFMENELSSVPKFNYIIDGITELV